MITLGIIGFGNMGSCIAERIKSKGYKIWVFDKDKNKTQNLLEINAAEDTIDLVNKVDNIILAVKPQDFESVLNEIRGIVKEKLIISIAAGITTEYIENNLGKVRVIRAMPNMPARIGEGITCLCKGKYANKKELDFSKEIFDNLGKTLILDNENMMDAATAVSGSGPGYFYDLIENKSVDEVKKFANDFFIPSLTASAESIGFSQEQSCLLAKITTEGSMILLEKTKLDPSELKKQVASKGGTTEAALDVLHKGGSLKEAVQAALKRAKELSK